NVQPEGYTDLFVPYDTTEAAQAALDQGKIAAYMEIPVAYMVSGRINLYTYQDTPDRLDNTIERFMLLNLTNGSNIDIPLDRIQGSDEITVRNVSSGREVPESAVFITLFLPVIFGFLFIMASITTSGFLMAGLVEERTNRIIEILVTSITPTQMLMGKIIGLGALGLLQVGVLLTAALLGLTFGHNLDFLQGVSFPPDLIVLVLIYFLLTYFMLASLMAGIGVLFNSEQESRQISGLFNLPIMIPYILFVVFITDPNGTVPTILSFIPFTAPMAILIRVGLTEVPTWQILLSMAIMIVTILIIIWASARVFRWGMLLYGKRFNLFEVLRVIFSRQPVVGTSVATTRPENVA
ncbi:MAG TPA: ABC transporter permease, partial [Phototrophicaceae bacterium]|nr:ABC transporter permease [Phototrophicaceae bacterium]